MSNNTVKLTRKHKAVILLTGLLNGCIFEHDGNTYAMDEGHHLCQKMQKGDYKDGQFVPTEDVWVKISMGGFGLKEFIDWAEKFTDDEIFIITAQWTLTEINKKDRG